MIKTLFRQIGKYWKTSLLTPIFTSLEVVMDVLIPYVTAKLIDCGINAGDMAQVYHYGLLMIGMAFLSLFFGIASARFASYSSTGFACNLRQAMYENIQRFAFSDIDKFSTSGLVTRMTTDVMNLQQAYQQLLRVSVRAPFRLVLSIIMCLVIDARLSLIFVVALVVLSFALGYIISHVAKMFTKVFEQYDVLNQTVQENIGGMRVVKAFVREEHEKQKFSKAAEGLYKLFVKTESLMAFNQPIMNMVVYGCMIALSWWGAHFIVSETLTTGELTSLFTYVMSILQSLMMLSMVIVMLTQSAASGRRVAEVIDEVPDIVNPENALTTVADGSVSFEHVSFGYTEKLKGAAGRKASEHGGKKDADYAISDMTFTIDSGETIGVIGGTGSGKSTLVNLISRLYDVTEGRVCVGGNDVCRYDLETLRNAVSVVLQQNLLFTGSLIENLRWGNGDATLEECQEACRQACADEFIDPLPEGYDTHIEQGGANFSGGQRQRLCIARALLKHPKILILDDSTSACDTATDARIRESFRQNLPEVTKIIIAQRISSVKDCNRIIVMENGKLIGFDTHERLLQDNSVYREINAIQTNEGGDFDEVAARNKKKGGTQHGKK